MDNSSFKNKGMTDIRQTENYAFYLKSQGWIVERIENINYFIKKLPIIGSFLKIQRPEKIDLEIIKTLEKKYHVFQTIIEPKNLNEESKIKSYGFKLSKSTFLPSKTLHLDLTNSLKFNKETRRSIKIGGRQKIKEYNSSMEIKIFHKAWRKSVSFNRYVPNLQNLLNLKKSFPNENSIFLASHNVSGSIIGGAIFTTSSHDTSKYITYYWHGFTNQEGRASLSQYSLLYQGILWAKKQGCKIFDFEGIYDNRFPNKNWLGFTRFKKQFGGKEILYPGCYVKLRFPYYKTY